MSEARVETIFYRRSRFATRLPVDRIYTPAHYWLLEEDPGVWRVGLTGFATRMLGDLVEFELSAKPGAAIAVGETIGWLEGFKAVADLYSVAGGECLGGNPELARDITLIEADPYRAGWLYRVRGEAAEGHLDVHGYVAVLDATVDRMLHDRHKGAGDRDDDSNTDTADGDTDGEGGDGESDDGSAGTNNGGGACGQG